MLLMLVMLLLFLMFLVPVEAGPDRWRSGSGRWSGAMISEIDDVAGRR
jgi:hypothetical protein